MAIPDFGKRLKEIREGRHMTQHELAEKSGVKFGTIQNLEQSRSAPLLETAVDLAKALGVDLNELLKPPTDLEAKPKSGRPTKKKILTLALEPTLCL